MPSAAALREMICFCLSDGKVSQYLGAGKATFVCGSCTCRLNRSDTIVFRRKYEAVREDLEAQEREILLWQSQAQAQLQPRPQRVVM